MVKVFEGFFSPLHLSGERFLTRRQVMKLGVSYEGREYKTRRFVLQK
jgi:hypothetical protein